MEPLQSLPIVTRSLSEENFAADFRRLNFTSPGSVSSPPDVHLPDVAVRSIVERVLAGEPPGHCLVHLSALCGVNKQFRSVAREVSPGLCVGFDVLDNTFCSLGSIQKFRRLPAVAKEEVRLPLQWW